MARSSVTLPPARYEYGADEFIFVEVDQAMSLEANLKAMAITAALAEKHIDGVIDICPSNASYLVRVNPDQLHPAELVEQLRAMEHEAGELPSDYVLNTRVIDVPVLYDDPWTRETLMRFRDHHQDPQATDLEYAARINRFDGVPQLIEALSGAPFIVTMIGFVPGLPFCYQMVPRDRQIEVPKYVRPRTDTPERAFGYGGAFAVVYPVRVREDTNFSASRRHRFSTWRRPCRTSNRASCSHAPGTSCATGPSTRQSSIRCAVRSRPRRSGTASGSSSSTRRPFSRTRTA